MFILNDKARTGGSTSTFDSGSVKTCKAVGKYDKSSENHAELNLWNTFATVLRHI